MQPEAYGQSLELVSRSLGKLEMLSEIARLEGLVRQLWRGLESALDAIDGTCAVHVDRRACKLSRSVCASATSQQP